MTPRARQYWPQEHNLNTLGRGLLGDATYQISKRYALWFQTRRIFKVLILKIYFSLCVLDIQWTRTIRTTFIEVHIRIIPAKFGQNQPVD